MAAADRSRKFTLTQDEGPSAAAIDQIMDDLGMVAKEYQVRPVGEIMGQLVALQNMTFTLLESKRARPKVARDLYVAAGVTTGLLAKASHDLARPNAAVTQARAAYLCAEQADHPGLRAWIHGLQALICYWAGRHHYAIQHTQQGLQFATQTGGTAAVWLWASEARSHAALGAEAMTTTAIANASNLRETVSGDLLDEFGGICTFGLPRQQYYAADALAWFPTASEHAKEHASNALELYRGDHHSDDYAFGDAAGARTDLAISYLNASAPDIEGALEAIRPVLALEPGMRINGIIRSAQRVSQVIRQSALTADPAALQIVEAIEDFSVLTASSGRES